MDTGIAGVVLRFLYQSGHWTAGVGVAAALLVDRAIGWYIER